MKTIRMLTLSLVLVALLAACRPCGGEPPSGCTVLTVAKGDRVFFGGNDDYIDPDSYYWVEPGQGDDYGVIWIGTPDNVQQGVNEMGLAYDANGLPEVEMNPHPERIPWSGGITSPQMHILHECATVEEVIEWVQTHRVYHRMNDQKQFADASGDAVLISPGPDGELVFTRKPPGDGYLVSTNYNVTNPDHGYGYPCTRYETAQGMLGDLVAGGGALTVQDAASVLDAVHQEGGTSWTLESLVADLPNGVIYLYYFAQFDRPVVLNVADELAHPRAPGPLSVLFPHDVRQEAARRYARIQAQANRCRWAGMAWIAAVLACLVLLVVLSLVQRQVCGGSRGLLFWVPVVIVLGPLGFLAWLIVGRKMPPPQPSPVQFTGEGEEARARLGMRSSLPPVGFTGGTEGGRAALLEATGDVTPTVVAFAIYLALALSVPAILGSELAQLALILGLPLAVGWLVFQGPLLAWSAKRSYLRTLWARLPHALVAANLGMAGINVAAGPLINLSLRSCSIFPTPGWTAGILWAIVVLSALLGGLLLYLQQSWAVRHGLSAWRVLAWGGGEVRGEIRSGSWRTMWWWVVLSYLALVGGVVASVVLQQLSSA